MKNRAALILAWLLNEIRFQTIRLKVETEHEAADRILETVDLMTKVLNKE